MSVLTQRILEAQRTQRGMGNNYLLTQNVIKAAMKVHSTIGPGLFEEIYKICLKHELVKAGFDVKTEVPLSLVYDDVKFDVSYRIDIIVDDLLILELKTVQTIMPVHRAQLLTYLKLSKKETGLLLNFNSAHLKDGIKRISNSRPHSASPASPVSSAFNLK